MTESIQSFANTPQGYRGGGRQFARLYANCPVRRQMFRLHGGGLVLLCQTASLAVRKNLLRLGLVRRLKVIVRGY